MDNAEPVFLDSIRQNPDDDTARLVYADWLDERGDLRGEWLRLEVELAQCPAGDERVPKLRERLSTLADGVVDADWLAQVVRTQVSVCGQSVRFNDRCSQRWDRLADTDQTNVRYCPECHNAVFLCRTVDEAFYRAEHGRCVVLAPGLHTPNREQGLKKIFRSAEAIGLLEETFGPREFGAPDIPVPKSHKLPEGLRRGFEADEERADAWLRLRRVAHRRQLERRQRASED